MCTLVLYKILHKLLSSCSLNHQCKGIENFNQRSDAIFFLTISSISYYNMIFNLVMMTLECRHNCWWLFITKTWFLLLVIVTNVTIKHWFMNIWLWEIFDSNCQVYNHAPSSYPCRITYQIVNFTIALEWCWLHNSIIDN